MRLTFPNVLGIDVEEAKNPIQQIVELKHQREGNLVPFTSGRTTGFLFQPGSADEVLILPNGKNVRDGYQRVLIAAPNPTQPGSDLSQGRWHKHPLLLADGAEPDYAQRINEVLDSWNGAFSFVEEDPARTVIGLRRPQIGAVHAVHTHWIVSDSAKHMAFSCSVDLEYQGW
jgi:hypothetical protein